MSFHSTTPLAALGRATTLVILASALAADEFEQGGTLAGVFGLRSLVAADLDGDGDPDLVTADIGGGRVRWHENLDGQGNFAAPKTIASGPTGYNFAHPADLDGDGDLDVVALARFEEQICWVENTDALGNFGSPQIIATSFREPEMVATADLDGDGDLDLLVGKTLDEPIVWFENTDGQGAFGAPITIQIGNYDVHSVCASDLNGDGALDVLAGNDKLLNSISWYENQTGAGDFATSTTIDDLLFGVPLSVHAADLDGDGDQDPLLGLDKQIAWYENTDGLASFAPEVIIGKNLEAFQIRTADIDADGDLDVFGSEQTATYWFENLDGMAKFGGEEPITSPQIHSFQGHTMDLADLDGDGDLDLAHAVLTGGVLDWYAYVSCPATGPALEVPRLGTPANPLALMPGDSSGPVVCNAWDPFIDHTNFSTTGSFRDFLMISTSPANTPSPTGEGTFLVDLTSLITILAEYPGQNFGVPIPTNCAFVGASGVAQGGSIQTDGSFLLANSLDFTIGTSSAQ